MKTRECPSCAMEIDARNKVCPICGYEFPGNAPLLKWAALALAVLFILYMIFF